MTSAQHLRPETKHWVQSFSTHASHLKYQIMGIVLDMVFHVSSVSVGLNNARLKQTGVSAICVDALTLQLITDLESPLAQAAFSCFLTAYSMFISAGEWDVCPLHTLLLTSRPWRQSWVILGFVDTEAVDCCFCSLLYILSVSLYCYWLLIYSVLIIDVPVQHPCLKDFILFASILTSLHRASAQLPLGIAYCLSVHILF